MQLPRRRCDTVQARGHLRLDMKSDSVDTTQDASTYPTSEKQVQECTKKNKENVVTDDKRSNNGLSTGSEDGRSTSVGRDQDSNASLQSDTDDDASGADEEIEDWIEYIKRSTHEAEEKMKRFNIRCWIEPQRETEMATRHENCHT